MFPLALLLGLLIAHSSAPTPTRADDRPNVVIIYADDLGYADIGPFGAKRYRTPNLDRMAAEGIKFTDFYVAQAVCTASRTALLTGCYPNRLGMLGALGPDAKIGIADGERTLAEVCKSRGYATAIFGKWHLGRPPQFLPTHHGFDEYFGLPYSNDMWPKHPTNPRAYPELPLIEGDRIKQEDPDQKLLTTWYTEHAVSFIDRNHDRPFFLYVPHSMPHVPLFVSDERAGKSGAGLYGDVIAEIDWSVGQILDALKRHGLDEKTLVIFASDNGPWLSYGDHAGSAGPLREGKGTSFEGGVRVPFVARWTGKVPAGAVCREPSMTIDLLPTIASLIGAASPERPIDGIDITPLLMGKEGAKSPHEAYYIYWDNGLEAVRSGRWKLHFPHEYRSMEGQAPGSGGRPGSYVQKKIGKALFDLEADIGERRDVSADHPEVLARLEALAEKAREDLGDSLTGVKGRGVRQPGRVGP
jgi:arylsulfatase A-like enzyme